jgi:alkylation response protein AidB-like acyl-CoA dehydrogenase
MSVVALSNAWRTTNMEFFPWWSEDQKQLAVEVEAFVQRTMPKAEEFWWKREIPWDIFNEIVALGFIGAAIPREYGGRGLGATGACVIMEGLSVLPGIIFFIGGTMMGGLHQIMEFGSEDQKRRFLSRICQGETGCISITEPSVGTDAAAIETIAKRDGDHYILFGKKRFNSGAGTGRRYMLYARTSNDPDRVAQYRHLTGFIVEKGMRGFTVEKVPEVLSFENVQNAYMDLDGVHVPIENRIGEEGDGWKMMTSGLNFERTLISAESLGKLSLALPVVVAYARRRIQFGKPTIDLVNNQLRIADLFSRLTIMRTITYYSAYLYDSGKEPILESASGKLFNADECFESVLDAIQVMGGDGLTKFYPLQRLLGEAKICQFGGGTSDALKLHICRAGLRQMANDSGVLDRTIHPELGVPVSHFGKREKQPLDEQALLGVLAEDYRVNPGLHMTLNDLKLHFETDDQALCTLLLALEEKGLVNLYRKNRQIQMAKATHGGLRKAHPPEYYRWFPSWVKEENIF